MSAENKNYRKNRKWLWAGALITAFALVLFTGLLFFNNWLDRKLTRMVSAESQGVYTLQLHGLQASPLTGLLSTDSLSLQHNYKKWQQVSKQSADAPRMLLNLQAGKVTLKGLSYWNILTGKPIVLKSLSIVAPDIQIIKVREDTTTTHEPLHVSAKVMLKGLQIDTLAISQATLRYKHNLNWKNDLVKLDSVDLNMSQFKLDSQSFQNREKAYYARQIVVKSGKAHVFTTDAFYKVSAGSIQADTKKGSITVAGLRLQPLLKASEMASKKGKAITYTKAEVLELNLTGIQFAAHSRTDQLLIRNVLLNQVNLSAYKDKKNFRDKGIKPLPHDMVQQIKSQFHIDTVQVKGMYVRYDELGEKATETGHLYISNLNGSISNLSNMPKYMSAKKPAVIKARGQFMGKATVSATVRMPLLDKNGYHTLQAEVGEADPKVLNPILEPTNLLSIKSGHLTKGSAQIELNQTQATGTMRIQYQDFKIELLSESKGNKQSLGKKVLSKAANALAIKSENPKKGEKLRVGEISAKRDKSRSVFTYWKDALASGFLSSIGLDAIAEK